MGTRNRSVGIFLQVRLDSTRLPNKALLDLGGLKVIEHAMAALKMTGADVYALLTDKASAQTLAAYADKWGFTLFPGPAEDVLKRFVLAIRYFTVDTVVRATGDNPLVSPYLAERILDLHFQEESHYSGFLGMPVGTGVEILDGNALIAADIEAEAEYEREHVSPFILRREKRFRILKRQAPAPFLFHDGRVTLDTEEDYRHLCAIYDQLWSGHPIETDILVEWMKKSGCHKPEHSVCT